MQLDNPYDIFTEKQKKSLRFKITNLIVGMQCWFINRKLNIKENSYGINNKFTNKE